MAQKIGFFIPGSDNWKILPEVSKEPADIIISKPAIDSFYNTGVEAFLSEKKISNLSVTGTQVLKIHSAMNG